MLYTSITRHLSFNEVNVLYRHPIFIQQGYLMWTLIGRGVVKL